MAPRACAFLPQRTSRRAQPTLVASAAMVGGRSSVVEHETPSRYFADESGQKAGEFFTLRSVAGATRRGH